MYNIKTINELSINSKLLLNSDKETLEKLFISLNVDPIYLENMMKTIHDWYQKEPHLPEGGQLHDQFIARFLVMRKFSIENVKQKIDNYYTMRPRMAEFLNNRDPLEPSLNTYIKNPYWLVLPRTTPENYRVTLFRLISNDGVCVINLIKVILMIVDYRMFNDNVMGEQVILDYNNVTLQLGMQMTPVLISKIAFYINECLGPNIKGVHIINMPAFGETIWTIFKKFMKPKLVKRIHFYKSYDEVLSKFPKDIFPKDLGGTDDITCQEIADSWESTLSSDAWRKYFIEQDNIHTDESKRIKRRTFDDDFGLDGSFKKLSID